MKVDFKKPLIDTNTNQNMVKKINNVESDYTVGDFIISCLNLPLAEKHTAEEVYRRGLIVHKIRTGNFEVSPEDIICIKNTIVESGGMPYLYFQTLELLEPKSIESK